MDFDWIHSFSIFALFIKLWLFFNGGAQLFRNNTLLAFFLVALFLLNISELYILTNKDHWNDMFWAMAFFYAFAAASAVGFLLISLKLTEQSGAWVYLIILIGAVLTLPVFVQGIYIQGTRALSYSATRVPGEHFIILQLFLLTYMTAAVAVLGHVYLRANKKVTRRKAFAILLSTIPVFGTASFTLISFFFQDAYNATVVLSLAQSLMLVMLISMERKHNVFLFLKSIPYTHEHRIAKEITNELDRLMAGITSGALTSVDLSALLHDIENRIIRSVVDVCDTNEQAARILNISRAKLYRRLKEKDKLIDF